MSHPFFASVRCATGIYFDRYKTNALARSPMGAPRVEHPVRKPPRKNQSYDGRLTGPTPSDSARRDLSISAIKKITTIFDLTTRTVPLKSTPKLGKKATHDGADSAIRRPPRSLSARRRRRNFWPGSAVCTARRPSARRCSRAPASTARRPPRWCAAPGERGERTGRPVAG